MSKLQEVAKKESSKKLTENGAVTYNTTFDACVDFFGTAGALRPRSEHDIISKFKAAFDESPEIATKLLFYTGNIRGGLGERRTFRILLKWLAQNHPEIVERNIKCIPLFNRWDSIFCLVDTPVEQQMWDYINEQLVHDVDAAFFGEEASLLGKWMPSENASAASTRKLARKAARELHMSPKRYRKMLSILRHYLDVPEVKMSAKEWKKIRYSVVPSRAMMAYSDSFRRHDPNGFKDYMDKVKEGKSKINASVLYPYDLIKQYLEWPLSATDVTEEQWKALPNYIENESNILIMADVSGSMWGRPLETSIGLAIYFAERNKGPLHGVYMTFTKEPHFQYINEADSLEEKIEKVEATDIGYSTNLEEAFDYLLVEAKKNNFSNEDMPSAICVISDMEIDKYKGQSYWDFIEVQKAKYEVCGYDFPKMILWNVEARQDTFLSQSDDVLFVSGQSPSVFKQLVGTLNGLSAYDFMMKVLNDSMYDCIVV